MSISPKDFRGCVDTDECFCLHRALVKSLALFLLLVVATSCTTLENRRDLYRSPREGYEQWYPQPPPTRLPSTPPTPTGAASAPPN